MKGLALYGAKCTIDIWKSFRRQMKEYDITYVEYPHFITEKAENFSDITEWLNNTYHMDTYDFILGHSMGGIIALEMLSLKQFNCNKCILIDSILRPTHEFYRNLMLPANMNYYGEHVLSMIKEESQYYSDSLKKYLQRDDDFTNYVKNINAGIYGIYGDRGQANYNNRIKDLCLPEDICKSINFRFVKNSCHMPMIENPLELANIVKGIIGD
ncbi:MAG: hypothetical protein WCD89_20030 [Anaerocolumna sp.]